MKAVRIHQFGGLDTLTYEDAPIPNVASNEVLIRVHAAGVNPVDWKVREGHVSKYFQHSLPLILGWDVSGVVEQVGADVSRFQPGDEVYGNPSVLRDGAYAEYITVSQDAIALKPKTLSHVEAASLPIAAMTAWQALFDVAGLTPGQKVLIHAAAGGVGIFAVQFAHLKGAYVIGTASERNQSFLQELGIDECVDYQKVRFEDVVQGVDVVLDTVGNDTQQRSWQVLKPGGFLVSIVGLQSEDDAAQHGVRASSFLTQQNAMQLTEIAQLVDAGKVKTIIDQIFLLADAREAQALIQQGRTRGKIVLRVV
jgi:NADPH:quinone reductase-like Zn-dependent oxidoreductase